MGTPQATQQIYSSSEKVRSKLNSSVVEDIAARTVVDQGTGNDGIGFGNRQKDILNSKQQHTYNPDQVGCRHENAATLISQSRSLDSRPLELQGPHGSIVGQLNPAQLLHREENSNGEDLPKYFLSTPPKHPQRFLYPGSNTRNLGTIHDPQPVEQNIRYNIVPGIGSSVSDSGTSPGGGNPFYLGAATMAGTTSLGLNHREVAGGGQDVRARSSSSSSSTSMGLIGSEADCDGNVGTGVGGASPPYLSFSTQLMSTSPEVGYGFRTLNLSERPQGTMTLYQTPGYRQSLKEDGHQPIDSREQQHNRLIVSLVNFTFSQFTIINLSS